MKIWRRMECWTITSSKNFPLHFFVRSILWVGSISFFRSYVEAIWKCMYIQCSKKVCVEPFAYTFEWLITKKSSLYMVFKLRSSLADIALELNNKNAFSRTVVRGRQSQIDPITSAFLLPCSFLLQFRLTLMVFGGLSKTNAACYSQKSNLCLNIFKKFYPYEDFFWTLYVFCSKNG